MDETFDAESCCFVRESGCTEPVVFSRAGFRNYFSFSEQRVADTGFMGKTEGPVSHGQSVGPKKREIVALTQDLSVDGYRPVKGKGGRNSERKESRSEQ